MHPRQRRVDEGMGMASTVEHLLAMFGYIIVLIGIAGLPPSQVPPLGAGAQTLTEASAHSPAVTRAAGTWIAPGRPWLSVASRGLGRRQHQVSVQHSATIKPYLVDPSHDRRADLMDMAISIRWHRGDGTSLPPGSD